MFFTRTRCLSVAPSYTDVMTLVIVDVGAFVALDPSLVFFVNKIGISVVPGGVLFFIVATVMGTVSVFRVTFGFSAIVVNVCVGSLFFATVNAGTFTVVVIISVNGSVLGKVVLVTVDSVIKVSSLTLVNLVVFGSSELSLTVVVSAGASSRVVDVVVVLLCLNSETYLKYNTT